MKKPTKAQLKTLSSQLKRLKENEAELSAMPGNTLTNGSIRSFNLKQIEALEAVLSYFGDFELRGVK